MNILDKVDQWAMKNPNKIALDDPELIAELNKYLSHKQDSICPFCKELECEHWNGLGWINPKFLERK